MLEREREIYIYIYILKLLVSEKKIDIITVCRYERKFIVLTWNRNDPKQGSFTKLCHLSLCNT